MNRVFTAYGQPLALEPRAFGMLLFEPPAPREAKHQDDGVAVVEVQGPLMHHADYFCDSYDAIKARVLGALDNGARTVVLSIDSPGGLVSGCFDTSDEIRAACDARGAELVAYVDGQATSAAYALACVASRVFVPATGIVGSIGVIDALVDATAQDRAMGLGFSIITSGARKADGNPHAATTDAAVAAAQSRVDSLAEIFFDHVSRRRGISTEKVAALQAGVVHGAQAVRLGLADDVKTLDQVLALVRSGADVAAASAQTPTPTEDTNTMDDNEKAYRASLQAILDDEKSDEKAKAKAKAILAAMDGEPDGDEPPKDEGKADGDDGEHKEPDGDEAKAGGNLGAVVALGRTANTLEARVAQLEQALECEKRATLRASRPDVAASVHDALASLPLAQYAAALGKIERPKRPNPAAATTPSATRGGGEAAGSAPRLDPKSKAALDRAMGLTSASFGVEQSTFKTTFGAERVGKEG